MKPVHRRLAVLVLALCVLAPRPSAQPAVAEKEAAKAPAKTNRLFLWKVTGKSGGTAYLLGSIHAATPDLYPLPKEMVAAFEGADALAVEVDITKVDQLAVQKALLGKGMYPLGDTLGKHVPKETLKKFRDYCAAEGLPAAAMEQFRPWALFITVTMLELQSAGYSAELGIDKHFLEKAGDKKVVELETATAQIDLLASLPEDMAAESLESTLDAADETAEMIGKVAAAWKAGDAAALEELSIRKPLREHPELKPFFAKLFDERNAKMAQKVDGFLKGKGTHFVVVGAGHLVGDKGLVKLLEKKGYKVEQVTGAGEAAEDKAAEGKADDDDAPSAEKKPEQRKSRLFPSSK